MSANIQSYKRSHLLYKKAFERNKKWFKRVLILSHKC
nr:MAG TPA: hypothetical protein [Herelleviridae sp.]